MASSVTNTRFLTRSLQRLGKDSQRFNSSKTSTREVCSGRRSLASVNPRRLQWQFDEIQIKVPWGHIAGKWYGPKEIRPIVGLHGWQDNAGTFDRLAPLLPEHISFLSIDLPGHGLSSWLPEGMSYHLIDYVSLIPRIMDEFKWDKISLLCHSLNSKTGFVFSSLFPDECDLYIAIDLLKPYLQTPAVDMFLEKFVKITKANRRHHYEPPCYDYEELIEKVHKSQNNSINRECCEYILKRNIKPSLRESNKYYFSRDRRLRNMFMFTIPEYTLIEMAQRIECPHLYIKASEGLQFENQEIHLNMLEVLKKKPLFEYHIVDGKHHVHLNDPEKVANIINPFIIKHRPK